MNKQQVKEILSIYRPGTSDQDDPEVAEALRAARGDAELEGWLERQAAFHHSVRADLREIPVPAGLKGRILTQRPTRGIKSEIRNPKSEIHPRSEARPGESEPLSARVETPTAQIDKSTIRIPQAVFRNPHWWRRAVLLAAACVALSLVVAALWSRWPGEDETFTGFRSRMVGFALREYRMDVITPDPAKVREHLQEHGAPADYVLTPGLKNTPVMGGASLTWQSHPVSMVCFKLPQDQILYMFVMDKSALPARKLPPPEGVLAPTRGIMTASWTSDGKVYLIAAPVGESVLKEKTPRT